MRLMGSGCRGSRAVEEWEPCAWPCSDSGVVAASVDVTWAGTCTVDVALLDVEKYRMHCIFATTSTLPQYFHPVQPSPADAKGMWSTQRQ